jgi:hypothetical protein
MRRELSAAVKELALHVRTRLESCVARGAGADHASIEALIILQKAIDAAETDDPALAARMVRAASDLLLETPLFAPEGALLDRWLDAMTRADACARG